MEELNLTDIQSELEEAREQQRLNIPAKRLLEKLVPIPSNVQDLQRRWFWELLQNASDYNDTVDVILELYTDKVIFKHNGNPFRPIDTENLIAPDSGKDTEELKDKDMIGQFGTGFISTHVLSGKIKVEGVIKSARQENSYSKFTFYLDRINYNDKEELKKSIQISSRQLSQDIQSIEYNANGFNTIFTYDLATPLPNINTKEVVRRGLEYVADVLPFTLAFMPKVKSVKIVNNSTEYFSSKSKTFSVTKRNTDEISVSISTENESDTKDSEEYFKLFNEEGTELIIPIQNKAIAPYPKYITKLFCSLPMIGTEDFCFPVIINAKTFLPKNERDGINLSGNDTQNRKLLSNAVVAFSKLLTFLETENINDCYHLFGWSPIHLKNEIDKKWYKDDIVDKIRDTLLNSKIVLSDVDRIFLKETLLPFIPLDETTKKDYPKLLQEFYDIVARFKYNQTPESNSFIEWYNHIDFSIFPKNKFTVEMLLDEVSKLGNLEALSKVVKDHTKWLNDLIRFVLSYDDSLLDKYKIIPNQLDIFLHRKDEVYWDDNIDDSLFEIYQLITGKDFKNILLHKSYEENISILPKEKTKSNRSIAKEIDDSFSEYSDSRESKNYLSALRSTFKWFNDSGLAFEELKDMFKWFASHRPQLFLETFDDEKRDQAFVIVQSGKLQSLARLAESSLTENEINAITNNVKSMKELVDIVSQIGTMEDILDHARELLEDKLHFDYLRSIGENVELVFKEALLQEGINAQIIHQGWGSHDFEIKNAANNKSMFVELKSYANGSIAPFKFAISQAQKAVNAPQKFAVCVLERPASDSPVTPNFIIEQLKYRQNITPHFINGLNDNNTLEKIRYKTDAVKLYLNLREEVRISISKNIVLENADSFKDLIGNIKKEIA